MATPPDACHPHFGGGVAPPEALTSGFALAFWVGVGFAALSLIATLVTLKREDLVNPDAVPMPA